LPAIRTASAASSAELGALVRPKRPIPNESHDGADAIVRSTVASRLEDVDEIVRELEAGRRGIPVLLRQYLKLNAKLRGFSVDPAFGHVLDGLIVVDLATVSPAILARYLGKEDARRFIEYHRAGAVPADGYERDESYATKVTTVHATKITKFTNLLLVFFVCFSFFIAYFLTVDGDAGTAPG
jgi:hypothetical protein